MVLLISTTIYTYFNVPESFYIEGGSCYQGISATINIFMLKICFVLSFAALILMLFDAKIIISKIMGSVSLYVWVMWTILMFSDAKANELFYCIPFLIASSLIVFMCFKHKKVVK
ncbi:hypothetical protein ACQ9BO_13295 [Flavobacterium sp. P21]|uniref:hypothetical protein n=1 Tax=Flavobacterium sp. P21 TaxID=3423948 RepID=UPI003D668486